MRYLYVLLLCVGCSSVLLLGQSKSWDRGAGTDHWHDSDNWDPNGVPTSFNDVYISTSSDSVFVNGNAECSSISLVGELVIPLNVVLRITGSSTDNAVELLRTKCRLENEGKIIIEDAQEYGIHFQQGELINKNLGIIEILSSNNDGIYVEEGKLVNQNNASIKILNIVDEAIRNQDTVINRGSMVISDCRNGIWNEGVYKNATTAQLSIKRSFDGINNYHKFSNAGTIEIVKFVENGILNDDDDNSAIAYFSNQGTIVIDSVGEDGFFNRAYLLNDTTGSITIQNSVSMLKGNGIYNSDTLDNHGTIVIRDMPISGLRSANVLFYNTGLTRVVRCGDYGVLIDGESIFRNEDDAELTIIECNNPIEVEIGSLFNCQGIITIEE